MCKQDMAILHHALGISDPLRPERAPYRNHFVAGLGHSDMPALERLERAGLMVREASRLCDGWVFSVTETGKAQALATRPRASRAKRRYGRYLSVADAIPGLTFGQFLTDPQYADYR